MRHLEAIRQIATFWPGESPFRNLDTSHELLRIETEFGRQLLTAAKQYVEESCPAETVILTTVGNPIELYSVSRLGTKQVGYSHTVSGEMIEGWSPSWFLIADEGADPLIINLDSSTGQVSRAIHGTGDWEFHSEADSPGQFLLCAAAIHHALTAWGPDVLSGNEHGLCLAEKPANWLFPRMKDWAGLFYRDWCSIFDNH